MSQLDELHGRLKKIQRLQFKARSNKQESGWNGSGQGSVQVNPQSDSLIFNERGHWHSLAGKRLDFSNIFRWHWEGEDNLIHLSHLRYGEDQPVYLFGLKNISPNYWQSVTPHHCRDDHYSAELTLIDDHIKVKWRITGPRKDENIEYWYRN